MTVKQDEIKNILKDGFNVVLSILVTVSLCLGSYGLSNVIELKTQTSVISNQIKNIETNINTNISDVDKINIDKALDKAKLDVLSERINSIDTNLKEIKSDLKELINKK